MEEEREEVRNHRHGERRERARGRWEKRGQSPKPSSLRVKVPKGRQGGWLGPRVL